MPAQLRRQWHGIAWSHFLVEVTEGQSIECRVIAELGNSGETMLLTLKAILSSNDGVTVADFQNPHGVSNSEDQQRYHSNEWYRSKT